MAYFSKMGQTLSFKNNLERQIHEILKSNNRKIIEDVKLAQFEADILRQVDIAHSMNPRCKQLTCKFFNSHEKNGDRIFEGVYSINFYIYKAK